MSDNNNPILTASDQALADQDLLAEAAVEAGEIAMKFWRANPESWEKDDNQGPVSEADLAIDRMLHAKLLTARPDYAWLSEESADDTQRCDKKSCFIIDPIDGTRTFLEGGRSFSVSIGISVNGELSAAAVYVPAKNDLYLAAKSHGATLNGAPIKASTQKKADGAKGLIRTRHLEERYWHGSPPDIEPHFRASIAYRLSRIAAGEYDCLLSLWPTYEWDSAAGELIAHEAGAKVSGLKNEQNVYNKPDPRVSGLVVANADLHRELMTRINLE